MGGDKDFDDWIQSFENACIVGNHPESLDAKHRLYLEWLPLKLVMQALALYRQKTKVDYPDVKAEMRTMLTDPHEAFSWTDKPQTAFGTQVMHYQVMQLMHYPDLDRQYIIKASASLASISYILTQKYDGKEKVISYGSKRLIGLQQKWLTYDREFFALLCGIGANAHYLCHTAFLGITNHRPLLSWRKVDKKKDPTGRQTHWSIQLDCYEFEIIHKKGRIHMYPRRGDDDDDYASDDGKVFAGFSGTEDLDQLSILGMRDFDDYSAVKFNLRSSERKIMVTPRKRHFPGRGYGVCKKKG
jgi:hypothetical protein